MRCLYAGNKIIVPPIKCQGIKTKIVPFIRDHVVRDEQGLWIEPFVGTGVVAFNIAPQRALLIDKNQYIILLYQGIQNGSITPQTIREFLEYHGAVLEQRGAEYYREMRDSFNQNGDPLFFLFLNRSDFNGMIRFNRQGKFNVPFCQKPNRFSKAYITKICNQVAKVGEIMRDKDWVFKCGSWKDAFLMLLNPITSILILLILVEILHMLGNGLRKKQLLWRITRKNSC